MFVRPKGQRSNTVRLGPREPRRRLEQRTVELSRCESQQRRACQPQQCPRLPPRPLVLVAQGKCRMAPLNRCLSCSRPHSRAGTKRGLVVRRGSWGGSAGRQSMDLTRPNALPPRFFFAACFVIPQGTVSSTRGAKAVGVPLVHHPVTNVEYARRVDRPLRGDKGGEWKYLRPAW